MKNNNIRTRLLLAAVLAALLPAAVSCEKELSDGEISQQNTLKEEEMPGIYLSGEPVFSASPDGGEVYVRPSLRSCRIQTAGAASYVDVVLSTAPVAGETVNVTLDVSGVPALSKYDGKTFKSVSVLKNSDGTVSLWNRKPALGFVLLWY